MIRFSDSLSQVYVNDFICWAVIPDIIFTRGQKNTGVVYSWVSKMGPAFSINRINWSYQRLWRVCMATRFCVVPYSGSHLQVVTWSKKMIPVWFYLSATFQSATYLDVINDEREALWLQLTSNTLSHLLSVHLLSKEEGQTEVFVWGFGEMDLSIWFSVHFFYNLIIIFFTPFRFCFVNLSCSTPALVLSVIRWRYNEIRDSENNGMLLRVAMMMRAECVSSNGLAHVV